MAKQVSPPESDEEGVEEDKEEDVESIDGGDVSIMQAAEQERSGGTKKERPRKEAQQPGDVSPTAQSLVYSGKARTSGVR